jgi:hypothetical protein
MSCRPDECAINGVICCIRSDGITAFASQTRPKGRVEFETLARDAQASCKRRRPMATEAEIALQQVARVAAGVTLFVQSEM